MNIRIFFDLLRSVLLGWGVLLLLSPIALYRFIHGDYERYRWIISGPPPFSAFGGGPYQLWMGVILICCGLLFIGLSLLIRRYSV